MKTLVKSALIVFALASLTSCDLFKKDNPEIDETVVSEEVTTSGINIETAEATTTTGITE